MLARIMMNGFEEIKRTMATKEDLAEVREDLAGVKEEVSSVKEEQKIQGRQIASIERKLGGTLLSLDETVHRSEFNELAHRVEVLEK